MTTPALSGRVGRRTIRPPRRSCGDGGHSAFERPAQVAVVAGHVLAVVSAHDRAVALFPLTQAVVGQLPLMALMALYTIGGLTLLFAT